MNGRTSGARRALFSSVSVASLTVILMTSAIAAPIARVAASNYTGAKGFSSIQTSAGAKMTPHVTREVGHDVSPPLRTMRAVTRAHGSNSSENEGRPLAATNAPAVADPVTQSQAPSGPQMPAASPNFTGITDTDNANVLSFQLMPPDTNGAVGSTQYMEWVNDLFAVYNKSDGSVALAPTAGNALFAGFTPGGATQCQDDNNGDPLVMWDQLANRWFVSQFAFDAVNTGPYYQCVAISTSADATGSWYRYAFLGDQPAGAHNFNDYGKSGVWPDAYYMSFNDYTDGSGYAGDQVVALDRTNMLTGAAATMVSFGPGSLSSEFGLLPTTLDGTTLPPSGEPNFFVSLGFSSTTLRMFKFHVDFATPGNSTFTFAGAINVAAYDMNMCSFNRNCLPQQGTAVGIDALSDRAMYRLSYRNFGDHESLMFDHNVDTGSDHEGVRWYEIRDPNGTPTVYQQSTFVPDANHRWNASVAMDHDGNMAMIYSVTSSSMYPSIWYTGRLAGDTLSQMTQSEQVLVNGGGAQTGSPHRWGDYSTLTIDPTDDCTFWGIGEFYSSTSTFGWSTRIGSFKFPSCGNSSGISNPTLNVTPTSGTWAQTGTIDFTWNPADAVVPNTLDGFSFSIDQSPHATPNEPSTPPLGPSVGEYQQTGLSDGTYYGHFATHDSSGAWGPTTDSGPIMLDQNGPTGAHFGGSAFTPFHFQKSAVFPAAWGATDTASGIDHYSVQYRGAAFNGGFGAFVPFPDTALTSANITGSYGATFCFRMVAYDAAGNFTIAPYTSTSPCTAIPLKTSQVSSSGFSSASSSSYFGGGYKKTTTNGAKLTRTGASSIKHLSIIAYECSTCGVVDIHIGSFHVGSINLHTSSTHQHVLITKSFSAHSGTVTILVTSANGKLVKIEAVGLSRI